ncbi:MAG: sulfatase-like hydrolase/transferase [Planctomycetota bacterium]
MKTIALICLLCLASSGAYGRQPNVLLIQTDDLGYDDLSLHGNTCSETPNLDRLGRSSVRFRNFMVNSVCSPTRAALLTGRDAWRTGCEGLHAGKEFIHLNERTFADAFQEAGYATGMWGKWHNGKSDGYWPWDRGFDEAYFADLYKYYPSAGYYNEFPRKTIHEGEWSPKVLADYTIDFITKNQDRPFLAYLSFLTCHSTWNTPDEYRSKYLERGHSEAFSMLLGMLEFMDSEVGRVLQHVADLGLDENTIVIFMSDNGPNKAGSRRHASDIVTDEEWELRNNHGFLGNKSKLWQNGIKSPLFIRWQGVYEPVDVDRLVTIADVFPTLHDITGIALADGLPLDGRSFRPYLEGNTTLLPEKQAVFAHWHPAWEGDHFDPLQDKTELAFEDQKLTLVNERYKFIQNEYGVPGSPAQHNRMVLIDLVNDPLESDNLASSRPEVVAEIREELAAWFDGLIESPHAFTHTVFQVGWNGRERSEFPAFGPSKTVGTKNEGHAIGKWDVAGNYAEYRIHVHEAGPHEVFVLCAAGTRGEGIEMRVECDGQSTTAVLSDAVAPSLGVLELPAGEHTIKLSVIDIPDGLSPNVRFRAIQLNLQ